MRKGPLIIISGPAGTGKSTLVNNLLADPGLRLHRSVSATTRRPRHNEADGVDYHFWTRDQFERGVDAVAFLEWADVFGSFYGTPRNEVEPDRARGTGVILVIDVQGAAAVRQQCPDAVSIFLQAPNLEAYEQRLRQRRTDSEEVIERRLAGAKRELERASEYDYQVMNEDLERAVAEVRTIIQGLFERDTNAG